MKRNYWLLWLGLLFLPHCGLKYSTIFQEPTKVTVNDNKTSKVSIVMTAYNQEEDQGKFLFAGYDLYYYFDNIARAKKAMVKKPVYNDDDKRNDKLINFLAQEKERFPVQSFKNVEIYQSITIPVTVKMINEILKKGNNNNVKIYFHDHEINNDSGDKNPYNNSDHLIIDNVFPNYGDYRYKSWGDDDFKGFYDEDYYQDLGISEEESGPNHKIYKVYFYVLAKGFDTNLQRTEDYIESVKSSTVEVEFRVDTN